MSLLATEIYLGSRRIAIWSSRVIATERVLPWTSNLSLRSLDIDIDASLFEARLIERLKWVLIDEFQFIGKFRLEKHDEFVHKPMIDLNYGSIMHCFHVSLRSVYPAQSNRWKCLAYTNHFVDCDVYNGHIAMKRCSAVQVCVLRRTTLQNSVCGKSEWGNGNVYFHLSLINATVGGVTFMTRGETCSIYHHMVNALLCSTRRTSCVDVFVWSPKCLVERIYYQTKRNFIEYSRSHFFRTSFAYSHLERFTPNALFATSRMSGVITIALACLWSSCAIS